MNRDHISTRQLLVLLFTALLSPLVRALPAWTAGTAGVGAWLTGLLSFPVLLAMGALLFALLRSAPPGGGLAEVFRAALGKWAGGVLTTIYMVWALCLLSMESRLYAERMLTAGYENASPAVFLAVLLALVLWMGRKKLSAFVRAAEIFYLALSLALGLVLVFSILDLTAENVLPVWTGDLPGAAAATLVPLGVCGVGIYAAFLAGHVVPAKGDGGRCVRWLGAGCGVMTLLQCGVLAQLGPGLAARIEDPFFEVARGVGIAGAFQRVESVVIALWVLSDLAFLGLLTFACRAMAKSLFGERGERWSVPVVVLAALLGALFLFPDGFAAKNAASATALLGNLALGFAVPALVLLVQRGKEHFGHDHILWRKHHK